MLALQVRATCALLAIACKPVGADGAVATAVVVVVVVVVVEPDAVSTPTLPPPQAASVIIKSKPKAMQMFRMARTVA